MNVYYLGFSSLSNVSHVILFSILLFYLFIYFFKFHLEKYLGFLYLYVCEFERKKREI